MSPTSARKITQLEIAVHRRNDYPGTTTTPHGEFGKARFFAVALNPNGEVLARGDGASEKEALRALVQNNYRRVCRLVGERQSWRCFNCGAWRGPGKLEFHHKQFRSAGRLDTEDNIIGLCSGMSSGCDGHEQYHRRT